MGTTVVLAKSVHGSRHAPGGADPIGFAFAMFDTVKTASFSAAAGLGYDVDTTSASITATLEAAPPDGTQNFFNIKTFLTGHTLTIAPGAGDTMESGSNIVRSLGVGQSVLVQYDASTKIWREVADRTPLGFLAQLASPAFTGTPTAPTPTPGDNSTKVATTAYVDGSYTPTDDLGTLAFETPAGSGSANNFYRGDNEWAPAPGRFGVSQGTAAVAISAPSRIGVNCTVTEVSLVCTGAPSGSSLTYLLRVSTDGGSTWTTIQSLSISSGSTTMVTATPNYAITAPALLRVECTSAGSTTAAVGVLLEADLA
jgi:hypothetical protein